MRIKKKKLNLKKKISILMISSSSVIGGGTKHMFSLGNNLGSEFKVFYAIPENTNFVRFLNPGNHIFISERKLTFKDIFNLNKFLIENSIDIVHAHGKGAGAIARILLIFKKKPLIYTFHGIHLKCHNPLKRFFYILYEYLLGGLDSKKVLVSNSEKKYAELERIYLGDKSIIINNGVSNKLKKGSLEIVEKYRNKLQSSKTNIVSLCRFVSQKNIMEIVKIARLVPDLNFIIIGDGPLFRDIKLFIKDIKIKNVNLLGEKKNIFKYLYLSDIYLSTSLYEGLPISILEAMSIGLPIVASNVIGNSDTIVNGKSGFLYELHNVDSAANYLRMLAGSKDLRRKLGESAFIRQRRYFSKDLMISKYDEMYRKELI